jgi:hypothetical protein
VRGQKKDGGSQIFPHYDGRCSRALYVDVCIVDSTTVLMADWAEISEGRQGSGPLDPNN